MSVVSIHNLGKAYKLYPHQRARLQEWVFPWAKPKHQLKWILQDVNLTLEPGESVGIVGVNGAGKSTLLKMIAGTTQPTTGRVDIQGRISALLELGMGFHPDFTGRENVLMAGQLMGYRETDILRVMNEIEAFAGIGEYIDQPLRVYSSGMQMRLAFSVATAIRPDILIVDEALSVGDARFQVKCYKRIAEFQRQGTTLMLVSHSPEAVVKHCERALLIKDHRVVLDGPSRMVTNRYLDELFGKDSIGSVTTEQLGAVAQFGTGAEDVFHTHPGYCEEEHRWGHGGAAILDYLTLAGGEEYPSRLESNIPSEFYFKVRFDSDFDEVVPGFLIKTIEGIFLYGTNSFLSTEGRVSVSARAGDVKVFKFSLPMMLNEGYYLVSFGISSGNPLQELVPLDRRYDSVMIHVRRSQPFWGIVDMQGSFELCESGRV